MCLMYDDSASKSPYDRRESTEPEAKEDAAPGACRSTKIEFLNGFVVREGEQVGIQARTNERLVDVVKRGELKQDPRHITELRLS